MSTPPPQSSHLPAETIHGLFARQAALTPGAVAIAFGVERVTYHELDERADRLARRLALEGVRSESLVGIHLDRSIEMVVAVFAVLKAGGAYVPLDPGYPRARLAQVVADCGAHLVLSRRRLQIDLPAPVLFIDEDEIEEATRHLAAAPLPSGRGEQLAYVLYTSGSTGRPKGVAVEHRNALNYLRWCCKAYPFASGQSVPVHSSLSFDLTVTSLLAPLMCGACALLVPEDGGLGALASTLFELGGFSLVKLTPAHLMPLTTLIPAARLGAATNGFVIGGEALMYEALEPWRRAAPGTRLFNEYGPTETVVGCCVYEVMDADPHEGPVPIGRPIADTDAYVVDADGELVAPGELGELCIGGAGVGRGYLGRPDATAQAFVPDPFSDRPGARMYRTGDLARRRADGVLEFAGRRDHQVKVRGYRIELGEIESATLAQPGVRECVVIVQEDAGGVNRLVAYVVPGDVDHRAVRSGLQSTLPDHMVPAAIVALDALPLTTNGKVDRKTLPPPRLVARAAYEPPRTALEGGLAALWSELLGVGRVGLDDDFFDLGGDSLTATRVIARLWSTRGALVPFHEMFRLRTVRQLADFVAAAGEGGTSKDLARIVRAASGAVLPLSFAQERVWHHERLHPSSRAYQAQATLRLKGALDRDALERSLTECVRRHESLRTTFPDRDGQPYALVHPSYSVRLPVIRVQGDTAAERERELGRCLNEEFRRPSSVTALPLIRWSLFALSDEDHVLAQVEHHLVHDGWSQNVLLGETLALYGAYRAGLGSPLPELPVQFTDFALWQREWMKGPEAERQLEYWRAHLKGAPAFLELPADRPRPPVQTFEGAGYRVRLPSPLCQRVRMHGAKTGETLYVTLLTAFVGLLQRHTGTDDIVVAAGVANRRLPETEGMIGMIINNVALRCDVAGDPTFEQLARRLREEVVRAQSYQDVPFDRVVRALRLPRTLSYNPLVQVMFGIHDAPMPALRAPGLSLELTQGLSNQTAKFDLNIIVLPNLADGTGDITVIWEYNSDIFDESTIARMASHYERLLDAMIDNRQCRVASAPMMSDEELVALRSINETTAKYEAHACVHELFEACARRTPAATAVRFSSESLTYAELDERANDLADRLRRLGAGPETRVGICLERSAWLVVAALAVLKTGAAYVPLDPSYPPERIAFMVRDSKTELVVADATSRAALPDGAITLLIVGASAPAAAPTARTPVAAARRMQPEDLAYVIYTSGSTGTPKGVAIPHGAIVNLTSSIRTKIDFVSSDVLLAVTSLSFDIAALEIYLPLTTGASLVVAPREATLDGHALRRLAEHHGVTVLQATPSTWRLLMDAGLRSSRLRALCGGEALPLPLARELEAATAATWNVYGPTETTIWSTSWQILRGFKTVSIGEPVANTQMHILDAGMEPVPVGVVGELYLGGAGLARGYFARPELTAERFVPDPHGAPGGRLYRTGDRVRRLRDGTVEYLGRLDHQVKVRGHRLELGEIEAALLAASQVRACVAVARVDASGTAILTAYVTPDTVDVQGTRAALASRLPSFMVPSAIIALPALPQTANGKVDRAALPDPGDPRRPDAFVAPRTPLEVQMAALWCDVLGAAQVGVTDNFFDLGGHSLLATRLISRVLHAFAVELEVRALFDAPTVESLSELLIEIQLSQLEEEAPETKASNGESGVEAGENHATGS